MAFILLFLTFCNYFVFGYFLLVQGFYLFLLCFSISEYFKRYKELKMENLDKLLSSESIPKISIIIPAYNEESMISFVVNNLLSLSYRYKEIIIVNDGSKDKTLNVLKETFHLIPVPPAIPPVLKTKKVYQYYRSEEFPSLIVVDKENGGKVDTVNTGINVSSSDYFLSVDADTILSDEALQGLMRPFLTKGHVVAAGGTIGVANYCILEGNRVKQLRLSKNLLVSFQVVEYLRAFLFGRLGWNRLGGTMIVSGAFGLFTKEDVVKCGGYEEEIGDDADMVVRLHKMMHEEKEKYSIQFIPDLVAVTEVPETWKTLFGQRKRWQIGILNAVRKGIKMLFNPFYKKVGFIGFPYLFIIETISPIIEVGGYIVVVISYILGIISWYFAMWLFLLAFAFPILISNICFLVESLGFGWYKTYKNYIKLFFYSLLEQCGMRQALVFCRFFACFSWLREKTDWPDIPRKGFKEKK